MSSPLGIALHLCGSVCIVFGQTAVKTSHLINETSPCKYTWRIVNPPGHDFPRWRGLDNKWRALLCGARGYSAAGWTAFGVGNAMRFIAMRFGAQTVLAGLTSAQFVVIPAAGALLLGEAVTASSIIGILAILIGNALIITYGPAEVLFTVDQLQGQWGSTPMKILMSVTILTLALVKGLSMYVGVIKERQSNQRPVLRLHTSRAAQATLFCDAFLFSAFAALIGAWSVLFSKSLTYILTAKWPSQLTDWYSWLVLLAFCCTAAFWVRCTSQGLKRYGASCIIPLMQAWWMVVSVVVGGIYFGEFAELHGGGRISAMVAGLLLAIVGAAGMGCSGFLAEQHALISYNIVPVFGDNNVYVDGPYSSGGRFSLLPQGPLASELQMEHLTPSDVEADGADPSISASRCPSPELQSTDWKANMAVLADYAKLRDMPLAKTGSMLAIESPSAEEPYQSAVHVNASALSGAPAASSWPQPQPQLMDPRLLNAGTHQREKLSRVLVVSTNSESSGALFSPTTSSLARSGSEASLVSATSGRGSQYASASDSPHYSGSQRSWRGDAFVDAEDGFSDISEADTHAESLLNNNHLDSAILPHG